MKILIVEDEHAVATMTETVLRKHFPNAEIVLALTLAEGVIAMSDADVVILDLSLPDSQEPSKTLAVVAKDGFPVPTIIVTGRTEMDIVDKALELGAQDYIIKGDTAISHRIPFAVKNVMRQEESVGEVAKLSARLDEMTAAIKERDARLDAIQEEFKGWLKTQPQPGDETRVRDETHAAVRPANTKAAQG